MGKIVLCDNLQRLFKHFPELDGLVVGREEVMRSVLPTAPFYLVDLFLNFK